MVANPSVRRATVVTLALLLMVGVFAVVESPFVGAADPGDDCAAAPGDEFPGEDCDPCDGFAEGTCDPCVEFGAEDCRPCPNGAPVRGGCHPCGASGADPCPPCVEFLDAPCDTPSLPPGSPSAGDPIDPVPDGDYEVRPGDTLGLIAARNDVTLAALLAANPAITNPNVIRVGMRLRIPGSSPAPAPTPAPAPPTPTPEPTPAPVAAPTPSPSEPTPVTTTDYVVQPGDTFGRIAQDHGLSIAGLVALNPQITNPGLIFVGDVIVVAAVQHPEPPPAPEPTPDPTPEPTPPATPSGATYTVQAGDSLGLIAARNGLSVSALLDLNPTVTNPNVIFVGDVIVVG